MNMDYMKEPMAAKYLIVVFLEKSAANTCSSDEHYNIWSKERKLWAENFVQIGSAPGWIGSRISLKDLKTNISNNCPVHFLLSLLLSTRIAFCFFSTKLFCKTSNLL